LTAQSDVFNEATEKAAALIASIREKGSASLNDIAAFYRYSSIILENLDKVDEHVRRRAVYIVYDGLNLLSALGNPISIPRNRALDWEKCVAFTKTLLIYGLRLNPRSAAMILKALKRTIDKCYGQEYIPNYVIIHAIPWGIIIRVFSSRHFVEIKVWRHELFDVLYYAYTCWSDGEGIKTFSGPLDEYIQEDILDL